MKSDKSVPNQKAIIIDQECFDKAEFSLSCKEYTDLKVSKKCSLIERGMTDDG